MKKLFYTLSFIAVLSIAGKAQTDKPAAKQEPAKKETAPAAGTMPSSAPKEEKAAQPATGGTRMAINEKGVPASKAAKDKAKEEKAVSPGQPGATEKK